MPAEPSEPNLVNRIRRGDSNAVQELVESYGEELCRIICTRMRSFRMGRRGGSRQDDDFRSEVNSVFHNSLTKLIERIRSSDLKLENESLVPYLVTIATNVLRSEMRTKESKSTHGQLLLEQSIDTGKRPETLAEEREMISKYRVLLTALPERFQTLIRLRIEEELSFDQIGERLGMGANAARARYSECVSKLRLLAIDSVDREGSA
jgi:RNA polymerase sigma-70 factor (ECF subfamily)